MKIKKRAERVIFWVSCACLGLTLAYGFGLLSAGLKIAPYYKVRSAFIAAFETYSFSLRQLVCTQKHAKYPLFWYPTNESVSGVVINRQGETFTGLTFFCDNACSAYLIDMAGNVVHQWHKDFYDVWPHPEHVTSYALPFCDDMVTWLKAYLYPADGSILAIYHGSFTPYGAGIIKLDASSNLVWAVPINAHHDLDVGPDGKIYVLSQQYHGRDAGKPCIDDYLTILGPDGKILKEISVLAAFRKSPYRALIPTDIYGDYFHTNSVELLTADHAGGFPFLACGDILLSHRCLGLITVLDKDTFSVKWALAGISKNIHDPDFLSDGRIACFNDLLQYDNGIVGSRIVEWDCINHKPVWQFTPIDFINGMTSSRLYTDSFFSRHAGSQQRLANGNYLVSECTGGTLYEIGRDKELVWKYVNPKFDGVSIGGVYGAKRYAREDLPFLDSVQKR